MTNYDLHNVCLYIHKFKFDCKIDVIPSTNEKYITLTSGVSVSIYQDKNELIKTVFEHLRFIESFRFMAFLLAKLASYLPKKILRYWTVASLITRKRTETSCSKRVITCTLTLMTLPKFKKRSSHRETNGKIHFETVQ